MGLLDTFRLRRSAAAFNANAYISASMGYVPLIPSMGVAKWETFRGIYLTNPWVHGTVNKISRGMSRLPVYVYALDDRGRKVRVRGDLPQTVGRPTGGQSLDTLLNTGFQGRSRQAVFTATMKERLYLGNALWRVVRDGAGMPATFAPIRWRDVVRVEEDDSGNPIFYELHRRHGGGTYFLSPADVIHFGLGSDSETCYGVSPLDGAKNTIALYDAMMRHLLAYAKNGMAPSGYVGLPEGIDLKRAQAIRQLTEDLYASPENAGKILMSVGKWQNVGDPPDKSQIIDLIKLSREEVLTIYDASPPQVGVMEGAIKSNMQETRSMWARDTIGPWASDFEGDLMAQLLPLVPSWRSLRVEFSFAEFLRPDPQALADMSEKTRDALTVDERREWFGQPPLDLPGVSDVPWSMPGSAPLTQAAKDQTTIVPGA